MKALEMTRPWGTLAVPLNYPGVSPRAVLFPSSRKRSCVTVTPLRDKYRFSAIIGVVEFLRHARNDVVREHLSEQELDFGLYSDGRWAYQPANPQPISPVPCKGARGLWDVPTAVIERIAAENPSLVLNMPQMLPFIETSAVVP